MRISFLLFTRNGLWLNAAKQKNQGVSVWRGTRTGGYLLCDVSTYTTEASQWERTGLLRRKSW